MKRTKAYTLFNKIAYGYLIRNYSSSFVNRCKDKIKVVYVSPNLNEGKVEIWCKATGNDFQLQINLSDKTIVHKGCYSKNKGYDAKEIIDYNLSKTVTPPY